MDCSCIKHCLCGSSSNLELDNVHCDAEQGQCAHGTSVGKHAMDAAFSKCQAAQDVTVAFQGLVIWRKHIQEIP